MTHAIRILIAVLAIAALISACGKKGPPRAPDKSEYPRTYPAPR
jgi:predicted small lipoprotein YifL